MFNIAPWGGLHENIWYAATGMRHHGWDVTVACRRGPLTEQLERDGVPVHVVADWKDWEGDARTLARQPWDVVHSHPFASRRMALEVARATGAALVSTFHGNNLDDVGSWGERASTLVAVSPAHADMLVRAGMPAERVEVVRNCVRDTLLEPPPLDLEAKLRTGRGRVVVASRLDRDKLGLLECVDAVTDVLRDERSGNDWVVEVLGDGRQRGEMTAFLEQQSDKSPRLDVEFTGWVDSERVPNLLRGAVLAVASGRGAAQGLAVGTPTVAFGSQGVYGLQTGVDLANGLWGNFGGYPLGDRPRTGLRTAVAAVLAGEDAYAAVQEEGRDAVRQHLLQSDADRRLDAIYRRALPTTRRWLSSLTRPRRSRQPSSR